MIIIISGGLVYLWQNGKINNLTKYVGLQPIEKNEINIKEIQNTLNSNNQKLEENIKNLENLYEKLKNENNEFKNSINEKIENLFKEKETNIEEKKDTEGVIEIEENKNTDAEKTNITESKKDIKDFYNFLESEDKFNYEHLKYSLELEFDHPYSDKNNLRIKIKKSGLMDDSIESEETTFDMEYKDEKWIIKNKKNEIGCLRGKSEDGLCL